MTVKILVGDCRERLEELADESVHCVVCSPPYFGLRDYGVEGQMGLEASPDEYVAGMVAVFRDVRRVLRRDGTLWLNIGDSYASGGRGGGIEGDRGEKQRSNAGALLGPKKAPIGYKPKDLIGIPWMLAFALRADGWWLRQDIIWSKPNPMPESVTDRCTKAHEFMFLLSKSERYYYDAAAIREPCAPETADRYAAGYNASWKRAQIASVTDSRNAGFSGQPTKTDRNKRSVWEVATQPFSEAHFATFPPALIEPCILAGCPKGGAVLDPFFGAGTTGLVADRLGRNCIGIELNPAYAEMARRRIQGDAPLLAEVA